MGVVRGGCVVTGGGPPSTNASVRVLANPHSHTVSFTMSIVRVSHYG